MFRLFSLVAALTCTHAVLDVHLCPHTHDDTGWLKTVDQYYAGLRNNIQNVNVKEIFRTVIPELEKDPSRKFTYVEMAFFKRWWDEADETDRARLKKLIATNQWQFINGGWCMNDEATTHYNGIIDNMAYGHKFLNDSLGVIPTIGWHIDPFGHSAAQASIFAQMGFDAFYFARIDYQDYKKRENYSTLELMWKGSPSRGSYSDIFTGVLYNGYGPPPGFCFDIYCGDDKIQNDPNLEDYNLPKIVQNFEKYAKNMAKSHSTNQLMLMMGSDFQYQGAKVWFDNLDILIDYFKKNPQHGINAFYSTPIEYTKALNTIGNTYTTKSDDFFPYADGPHNYWSGFFVSRPALKKIDRVGNSYLQKCKHFDTLFPEYNLATAVKVMSEAVGVNQHHDGITGTEKQHVADDYAVRTARGWTMCEDKINTILSDVTGTQTSYSQCRLTNQSVCAILDNTKSHPYVTMIVYNPLGQADKEYIKLPVDSKPVAVKNSQNQQIPFDFFNNLPPYDPTTLNKGLPHSIIFPVMAPPAGYSTYYIQFGTTDNKPTLTKTFENHHHRNLLRARPNAPHRKKKPGVDPTISNNMYTITFDASTGRMKSIMNNMNKLSANVDQKWGWYNASALYGQPSGAYIFRPNSSQYYPIPGETPPFSAGLQIMKGKNHQVAAQDFGSFIKQDVRLYNNTNYIEIEYTVGPIPISDGLGKEIVTKFQTNINTESSMFTDANGREMQYRIHNYRPTWKINLTEPVASNFFPLNAYLRLKDTINTRNFALITDRSQAAGVMGNGECEVMVHRRLLYDDHRGVGEPLNETQNGIGLVIRGKFLLVFGDQNEVTAGYRLASQRVNYEKMMAFTASNSAFATPTKPSFSAVKQLPTGIHLLTVQRWPNTGGKILLRLAHLFESGENGNYSVPIKVNLKTGVFANQMITSAVEMSLSGNQLLGNVSRMRWKYEGAGSNKLRPTLDPQTMIATLNPMDIGTYLVTLG